MTPLPLPRLASHGLAAPTAEDFRRVLRAAAREQFPEVWGDVCATAGLSQGAYLLGVEEQEALARAVQALPGLLGVVGRGLAVRVATYRALRQAQTGGSTAYDWSRRCTEGLLRARVPDRERLTEIAELDLFGERGRTLLDRAAARAAQRLGAPMAAVSVVLDGAQVFAGRQGMTGWLAQAQGTPVEWSFCATTLRTRAPYVVPDAGADVMQRTNPLVRRDGVGSYAGVPVTTSAGHVLGACCVLGPQRRPFEDEDVAALTEIAQDLVRALEAGRPGS